MDKNEVLKLLRQKLRANYEEYMRRLQNQTPPSLIEQAAEIAAARKVYDLLMDEQGCYHPELLEYLLRFENPLEVVRDQWMKNHGFDPTYDMEVVLAHCVYKRESEQGGYGLDKSYLPEQSGGIKLC